MGKFYIQPSCKWFNGAYPCKYWTTCHVCNNYQEIEVNILIVMLIRLGDMLILSPLPQKLKQKHPSAKISLLVDPSCVKLASMIPCVDEVVEFNWESLYSLSYCKFELVLGYERNKAAATLVHNVSSTEKSGIAYGGELNSLYALNKKSMHFFKMNIWNDYRTKKNKKTWTELYCELAGVDCGNYKYQLSIPCESKLKYKSKIHHGEISKAPYVICNIGGSLKYKVWPVVKWVELINKLLYSGKNVQITYGPDERKTLKHIYNNISPSLTNRLFTTDTSTDFGLLALIYKYASIVITGDSLGLHMAIWGECNIASLFGPSNYIEVVPKHYKNIKIIKANIDCSPCAHQVSCEGKGGCMDTISVNKIISSIDEFNIN